MGSNSAGNALTYEDYTVGWVCALPKEQVAAIAMLDKRHQDLPRRRPNDQNVYSLGSIRNHNVVIACLPNGRIGTTPAAVVASDLVETFPSIRIPLMVGIGGGVPANKVRLGDVVVSTPLGPDPGVIQWDLGKAVDGGRFERTGSLDKPSALLLSASSKLRTEHRMGESSIPRYLNDLGTKFPTLADEYLRSDKLVDLLFKATYSHVQNPQGDTYEDEDGEHEEHGNEACRYCDKTQLVRTKTRQMKIHYGLIASGNQVIKDAAHRDRLNKTLGGNVLCIEMEAAGLMDQFRCLVIRGICDYSDSHKNKAWQEHSAAVAAAYAKELLYSIPPIEVQMEQPIKDILGSFSQILSTAGEDIGHLKSRVKKSEDTEILNWLIKHDYGNHYSDFLKSRQPDTGQWLLDSDNYQLWRKTPGQTLFCPGIPGAGKTILASTIVKDLNNSTSNGEIGVAYIFCNFRRDDEQRLEDLTASLLKQLAQEQSPLPQSLISIYQKHIKKRTRPGFDELCQALSNIAATYSRLFIVIDALDECQIIEDCRNKFLDMVFNIQKQVRMNLCVTSRYIPDIEKRFKNCVTQEIQADKGDVQKYLQDRIPELALYDFIKQRPDLKEEIIAKIITAADGVFLLARLHFDSLQDVPSESRLRCALEGLAKGSNAYIQVYSDAMHRIKHQTKYTADLAIRTLVWLTCAKRQLTVDELRYALSIADQAITFDERDLVRVDLVSMCAGLVTVDEGTNIIRLIHFTVQEYFDRTLPDWFPKAQQYITNTCIVYLSFEDFSGGFCPTDVEFEKRLQAYPFYDYAAQHWGHHASQIDDHSLVLAFLSKQAQVEASSQALLVLRHYTSYREYSQRFPKGITAAHLTAIFGLDAIMQTQQQEWILDIRDSFGRTPLTWAARHGHEAVAKLLLAAHAEINIQDMYGRTPLASTARAGSEAVAKLLLAAHAEIEIKDISGLTPLTWAARNGYEAVVKLLLAAHAEIEFKDNWGETPLTWATRNGHEAVVKLLLATQAEIETKERYGRTPLRVGYPERIRRLGEAVARRARQI